LRTLDLFCGAAGGTRERTTTIMENQQCSHSSL
jgi:hypothetical protein